MLEAEDATLDKAISEVDLVITEKLKPFIKEEEELQQEKELIHKRQTEIEEETVTITLVYMYSLDFTIIY